MRNYSRQIPNTYYKFQSLPRNYTQQKRIQQLHTLKDTEVKVGIYKYSTQDELGKGYSSKVYKGVQIQKIHKRYAIKVIELKKFRGSNLEMLQAEIQIHRNLVHQNILRLYEVIKTPYFYYLILQYCPHGNLHEYIKQKKKLTESNAVEIMEQVLAGYKFLIEQGVIHRDLKPANILRIGHKWKISDFGFSVKSKYGFKDRINVGTPLYMPPQSLKKSYYSCKSDIFALGVILYEMIEGKTPWECSNQKQLLQKIKTQVQVPQHLRSAIIRDFIYKACQLNENKRMSRQQILQYQIRPPPTASQIKNQKISQRQSAIAMTSGTNSRVNSRKQSIAAEPPPPKPAEDIKQNTQILSNEFSLVRHIYSCLKNIDSFLIDAQNRQVLTLTLFKLLLRLIRFLCDKKTNHYNLKNWLDYMTTKSYCDLYQEMINLSEVLQKEYLQHIKHNDIKVIRNVNRKFPDLCHNAPISQKFYQTLKYFMVSIIREHNHELMVLQASIQEQSQQKIAENKKKLQKQMASQGKKSQKQLLHQTQIYKISSKKSIQPQSTKQDDERQEKIMNGSSAPRKIYESKRSLRRVSEIKIDDPAFLPQQHSKVKQDSKVISKTVEQKVSKVQINETLTQKSQQIEQKINNSHISEMKQELLNEPLTTNDKKQQIQIKIQSQTSIKPQTPQKKHQFPLLINDKIQALQSLFTIYHAAQLRSHPEQKDVGEKIIFIPNYSESKLERRDYLDLRRLLRNI